MTDSRKLRCRNCGEFVLIPLPAQPPTPAPNDDTVIARLVEWLTRHAKEEARIGQRVIVLKHSLQQREQREKLLTLAQRLNVSPARASVAVAEAEDMIRELRKS